MFIGNYLSFEKCLCGLQSKCACNNKLFNKNKINKQKAKKCAKKVLMNYLCNTSCLQNSEWTFKNRSNEKC